METMMNLRAIEHAFEALRHRRENAENGAGTRVTITREQEREYTRSKIAAKRRQMAQLAQEIRWLELESDAQS
jgi:hypothetical protein